MAHSSPYEGSSLSKKEQIKIMFDRIAPTYDLGNRLLSIGIDRRWRRNCVRVLAPYHPQNILDIATGTGDFAIACSELQPQKIVGIDISREMLEVGRKKIVKAHLEDVIDMQLGDAEDIPFQDAIFDVVTVAFGFRNYESRQRGLAEAYRVLRKGGWHLILEFSKPNWGLWRSFSSWYITRVVPLLGGLISKQRMAYQYLNDSIHTFPSNCDIIQQMQGAGFKHISSQTLSGGICRIWTGQKK